MHARSRSTTDPDAIELATWYHDAIYDPAATDNEARSADLLVAEMAGSQSPSSLRTAELMVRATADHIVPAGLPDAVAGDLSIFLDLDMAILGAEPAEYDVYEAGIAAEYVPIHGAEVDVARARRDELLLGQRRGPGPMQRRPAFHNRRAGPL